MSIKLTAYVWDHSTHRGSELLMLLAIADHANDDGHCWPSLTRLATRARVHKRQAINLIQKLEAAGTITIHHGAGRGHPSVYSIKGAEECTFYGKGARECTHSQEKVQESAPLQEEKVQSNAPIIAEKVHSSTVKGAIAIAPEPSLEPKDKERERDLTSFDLPAGKEATLPSPADPGRAEQTTTLGVAPPKKRPSKPIIPIPGDHWLRALLDEYRDEFDTEALNDWQWWDVLAKTFPDKGFTKGFVSAAFADLLLWLTDNPLRQPRDKKQWRSRIKFSLGRYYTTTYSRRQYTAADHDLPRTSTQKPIERRLAL